jgi:hypothetical protein
MSTADNYKRWCSLRRGDIIKIEGEKEERIVSHSIGLRDSWVLTFQDCYIVLLWEDEKQLLTFERVGHYVCGKDKEIPSTKPH